MVDLESVWVDVEVELQGEHKLYFEVVEFYQGDPSNTGVVGIGIVKVVEKFGSNSKASYQQSMNCHVVDGDSVGLDQTVNVNEAQDEAGVRTVSVTVDSFQVITN